MICEGVNCLPLWRWNPAAELNTTGDGSWTSEVGAVLFFLAGLAWNIAAAATELAAVAVTETALLSDRAAEWLWVSVPTPLRILIAAGVAATVFLPSRTREAYIRNVAKRVGVAGLVLGLTFAVTAAATRDVNAGVDTPAQTAGSPSWAITEIGGWGDVLLDGIAGRSATDTGGGEGTSGGVLDCGDYVQRLVGAASADSTVPAAAVAADSFWRRAFWRAWADTGFADAAGEVSCVSAEWLAGTAPQQIREIACLTITGAAAGEGCVWLLAGLPDPAAGSGQLIWVGPAARAQTARLVTPWYVCSHTDGAWRANPETVGWGALLTVRAEYGYTPAAVSQACAAWWDSTLPDNAGCSEEGNQLVCSPNPLPDRVDLSDSDAALLTEAEFIAAAPALRPELGDGAPGAPRWATAPDAAAAHELWSAPVAANSTSDATVRALAGAPDGVLTAGFLAAANALFYAPLVAAAALAVTVGAVMMLLAAVLLPVAAFGWAMEGRPRLVADRAFGLAKRGVLVWAAGFAVFGVLLSTVFILSAFFNSGTDGAVRQEQLLLFMLGVVFWGAVALRWRSVSRAARLDRFSYRFSRALRVAGRRSRRSPFRRGQQRQTPLSRQAQEQGDRQQEPEQEEWREGPSPGPSDASGIAGSERRPRSFERSRAERHKHAPAAGGQRPRSGEAVRHRPARPGRS